MGGVILALLLVIGVPAAIIIWIVSSLNRNRDAVQHLESRVFNLELALRDVRRGREEPKPAPAPSPVIEPPKAKPVAEPVKPVAPPAMPPPVRPPPVIPIDELPSAPAGPRLPAIDWEQFMGVKLFAWVGGFALFLGLVFFLKYAFENKLISPEIQVALEYVLCAGLVIGGVVLHRRQYAVTGQTLCATAIVALYAVTFATHSYYRLIGIGPSFAMMVLVTATAFLLAVRLEAQVVAVLGLLGGFLTPVLLSTGQDNPLGLFSYIALLDAGLIAVANRKRWNYLVPFAAAATILMQIAWAAKFFVASKVFIAMGIFLGFEALFLVAFALADRNNAYVRAAAIGMVFVPLAFALYLLSFQELGVKPWRIFAFILAADLGALTLVLLCSELALVHLAAGGAVFLVLATWTGSYISPALLNWALGFYFVFALLHAAFPVLLQRLRPGAAPMWWGHIFPPIALLLVMVPILNLPDVSLLVWFCILALDVIVFGLALLTASVLAILGALVLTLATIGFWIFRVPAVVTSVPELLVLVGGFALVFFVLGIVAARRIVPKFTGGPSWFPPLAGDVRAYIQAMSAILPFLLLIMVVLRMPLADPSPVFGLAMLLTVLLLGVARWTETDALAAVALLCGAALEYAWHGTRFQTGFAVVPLAWYLAFTAVFMVFPFVFRRALENRTIPWAVAALAGPVHFTLIYRLVKATWPNPVMGLLPAAFAIPPLIGLLVLLRDRRPAQLAWFGGATLFFVTLIFPVQFERQWITIGWALEGAALLWLWHRVPHNGLRLVGVGLLCAAFARLALNPAVLDYHPRAATAIWNWYLYTYGAVAAALFVGARLVEERRGARLLGTLGTVLAFLLLNIQIADYFTTPGLHTLTFQFTGNFARDMTYSIAWALFALTLLVAGIAKKLPAARYAALALLSVTLLKLFLHDLAQLNQLYRIGAFVCVAVVLLVASFLYQRFVKPREST